MEKYFAEHITYYLNQTHESSSTVELLHFVINSNIYTSFSEEYLKCEADLDHLVLSHNTKTDIKKLKRNKEMISNINKQTITLDDFK